MVLALRTGVYLGLGRWRSSASPQERPIGSAPPQFSPLRSVLAFAGLGLLSSAYQLIFKRGNPVKWLFLGAAGLVSGIMYPVSVLPRPLQAMARLVPVTYWLQGMRAAVLEAHRGANRGLRSAPCFFLPWFCCPLRSRFFPGPSGAPKSPARSLTFSGWEITAARGFRPAARPRRDTESDRNPGFGKGLQPQPATVANSACRVLLIARPGKVQRRAQFDAPPHDLALAHADHRRHQAICVSGRVPTSHQFLEDAIILRTAIRIARTVFRHRADKDAARSNHFRPAHRHGQKCALRNGTYVGRNLARAPAAVSGTRCCASVSAEPPICLKWSSRTASRSGTPKKSAMASNACRSRRSVRWP